MASTKLYLFTTTNFLPMSKIAEKLAKEGLVTPKTETNGNDQGQGNQSGSGTENGGEGDGEGAGGESAGSNGENNSGQGGNAGGQQGAGAGTEAADGGGSATGDGDLSDEALVQALQKRGMKVKSLNEVGPIAGSEPTEAEKQELEAKRRNSVRAYALENQIVTSTDFDNYARESSMPVNDLAFALYSQERIAEEQAAHTPADQMPTAEQLREEFDEVYFRQAKETDPKRKYADKLLQSKVDGYLQTKYNPIFGLEDQYDSHHAAIQQRNTFNETVENVVAKIGTEIPFKFMGEDGKTPHSYPVKVTPAQITAAKSALLSDKTFQILAASGDITQEAINATLMTILREQNEQQYLSQVVHAHTSKTVADLKKGRREIFSTSEEGEGAGDSNKPVNKNVKAQLDKPESKQILNKTT
jgi:hypothetical protein